MKEEKYTKEEMLEMCKNFGQGTKIGRMSYEYACDYDYDEPSFKPQMAVKDAVLFGIQWALNHLK